jgi:hypothetical protein
MRTRRPRALLLPLVVALAGCGGAGKASTPPERPALGAAVAERLASRSDAVAARLAAGDVCGAAHEADALRAQAVAAVAAGEVPPSFRAGLLTTARGLVDAVNCPPPPAAQPAATDGEAGDRGQPGTRKAKGKGKAKGKHKGRKDED